VTDIPAHLPAEWCDKWRRCAVDDDVDVSQDVFLGALRQLADAHRLLAVKSDDIVERVERIAAHRCGDCHRQRALAMEAAEKYAAAHNAMKQAVVIQSEQAAEIRRLRALLAVKAA
jgi:nitrate/TMAO reductase-like tetraheme cytochrome c subunit